MHDKGDVILHLLEDHGGYFGGSGGGREAHVAVRDERKGLLAERLRAGGKSRDVTEDDTRAKLVEVLCVRVQARQKDVVEVAGVDESFGGVGGRSAHVRVVVRASRADGGVFEGLRR